MAGETNGTTTETHAILNHQVPTLIGPTRTDNNNKKQKRLSNEDDCPIHGAVHKWGQCHQNQYGDNFRPRRTAPSNSSHHTSNSSYWSQGTRPYEPTPPSQVYFNQGNSETGSHISTPSHSNYQNGSTTYRDRTHHDYPPRENYYVSYNTNKITIEEEDFLPEGTMLIKILNKQTVALFGLCLFDSGSTSMLMNERAIPHFVKPFIGETQQVTTTQVTYDSNDFFLHRANLLPGIL